MPGGCGWQGPRCARDETRALLRQHGVSTASVLLKRGIGAAGLARGRFTPRARAEHSPSQPRSAHLEEAAEKFPLPIILPFFAFIPSSSLSRSEDPNLLFPCRSSRLLAALDSRGIKLTARISSVFGFSSKHPATPTGLSELLHQAGRRHGQVFAREKRQSEVIRSTLTRDPARAAKEKCLKLGNGQAAVTQPAEMSQLPAPRAHQSTSSLLEAPFSTPEGQKLSLVLVLCFEAVLRTGIRAEGCAGQGSR